VLALAVNIYPPEDQEGGTAAAAAAAQFQAYSASGPTFKPTQPQALAY